MDVIRKLNELRLARNLSVYRLSELSGINQSTLANTFSRGTVPSIANLEKICDAMGLTLSQFFSENDEEVRLTRGEAELLNEYRRLPAALRESVKQTIKTINETH